MNKNNNSNCVSNSSSRRQFLQAAGTAAAAPLMAASWARVAGANDRVQCGFIGTGIRGIQLMRNFYSEPDADIVAVSDLYDGRLARAMEIAEGHRQIATMRNYAQLLDRGDIDAIVIAVPDFWHKRAVLDAAAAGKHIYCEKPLLHTVEEGDIILRAVRQAGRIFVTGSHHISSPHIIEARDLVRSGELGQITAIKATYNTNNARDSWQMPVPGDASEKTIDWQTYMKEARRKVAFDPNRFFSWRRYSDYGESIAGDLLVHTITTVHFLMGVEAPPPLTMAVGGRFVWNDGRDIYDAISMICNYPEGFTTHYEATQNNQFLGAHIFLLGTKATMDLTFREYKVYHEDWPARFFDAVDSWPKSEREKYYAKHGGPPTPGARPSLPAPPTPIKQSAQIDAMRFGGRLPHVTGFMEGVQAGKQPVEDVVMGVETATTALLGNLSLDRQEAVHWNRKERREARRSTQA